MYNVNIFKHGQLLYLKNIIIMLVLTFIRYYLHIFEFKAVKENSLPCTWISGEQ